MSRDASRHQHGTPRELCGASHGSASHASDDSLCGDLRSAAASPILWMALLAQGTATPIAEFQSLVHYSLLSTHYLLLTTYYLLLTIYYLLFTTYYLLLMISTYCLVFTLDY